MTNPDGTTVPFDASNIIHKRSLPMGMRTGIFLALKQRAELSESQDSKYASPSVSGGTSDTGSSPAAGAASESATS